MKKLKVVGYFLPAITSLLFYAAISFNDGFSSIHPLAWCFVVLLLVSAILMLKNKWWGCIGGLFTGGILIYMGMQYTGQIINESPICIVLCIYYALCGLLCSKQKNQ